MPIRRTQPAAADRVYGTPFRGEIDQVAQIAVDITVLTTDEVDAKGYLKPGLPLTDAGAMVGVGDPVFGVTIEPIKVANGNTAGDLAAASTAFQLAVATHGNVNRKVMEDNLGRVLNANEVAGFALAPCTIKLL